MLHLSSHSQPRSRRRQRLRWLCSVNKFELLARKDAIADEVGKATRAFNDGRLDEKRYVGIVNKAHSEYQDVENLLGNLQ